MADVVTMDKIVSLCRRRGFVFPSSEIYGGLGSAYDYGHYGVLAKNNVKARWLASMLPDRDAIVPTHSSPLPPPVPPPLTHAQPPPAPPHTPHAHEPGC